LVLWSRQISIIDSIALVDRNVRARVGGTPSRLMVSVSASEDDSLAVELRGGLLMDHTVRQ
jgi:hypothetical protein